MVFPAPERPNSQMIFSFDANASSNVPIQTVSLMQPMYFLRIFLDLRASTTDGIGRYRFPLIAEIFAVEIFVTIPGHPLHIAPNEGVLQAFCCGRWFFGGLRARYGFLWLGWPT